MAGTGAQNVKVGPRALSDPLFCEYLMENQDSQHPSSFGPKLPKQAWTLAEIETLRSDGHFVHE